MELALLSILLGLGLVVGLVGGGDDDGDPPPANAGDDVITGTDGPDRIETGQGDDIVNSLAGDDQLFLGIGSDTANAGPDDDRVFGGGGADTVTGGPGNDVLDLGDGPDTSLPSLLSGVPQDGGDDTIRGGNGDDTITDTLGINRLFGDEGSDTLSAVDVPGDNTPDFLSGGFGVDTLTGDDGDELQGGERDDIFVGQFDETGEDPIIITDFDSDTETLTLQFDQAEFGVLDNSDLSFNGPTAGTVDVLVNGVVVAVLQNQTTFSPAGITVESI